MISVALAVETDGEHERARERQIEVVDAADCSNGPATFVSGSRPVYFVHVCRLRPADAHVDARQPSERPTHGCRSVYATESSRSLT